MQPYLAQYTDLAQSLKFSDRQRGELLDRFNAQLAFAHQLRQAHLGQAAEWQARILEAGRLVRAGLRARNVDLEALVAAGEAELAPIGQVAKEYTLLCVSHAHIDMNWMWSWPETVAVTNDTFQTMLALMEEFPGFVFSQSQASTYSLIEKFHPELFEAIRARVRDGRWEVTASTWVEGEKNMASGESISRHLLYTRAYFQEKFGLAPEDVQLDFEPDTFGHPATLPSILARGGVKYYYHCRGSVGPHLYWWVGPDGSRILVYNDVVWYMATIGPKIADPLVGFALATGMKSLLVLYGVGDHGGGPTRRDLLRMADMATWPVFPKVEFSALHRFYREAEATATRVPEIVGERNFVFTGCYTSQARQKWANRHGENILFTAEAASLLGNRLAGVAYPQANLDEAWRAHLFEQFHDILPGSGVRETRHHAMGKAQEVQAAASMARSNALRGIAARVNTAALLGQFRQDPERAYKDTLEGGMAFGAGVGHAAGSGGESSYSATQTSARAFLVFNPLPYARSEVVEAKLWDTDLNEEHLVVTGEGVEPRPVQVLDKGNYWGHRYTSVAFPADVPACGYRALCISDRGAELGVVADQPRDLWALMHPAQRRIPAPDYSLENEVIRAELDPASGGVVSLLDKRSGREWVPAGKQAGVFQYNIEQNTGMTAWVIGPFMTREDLLQGGALKKLYSGPYIQSYRWTRKVNDTMLELDIVVRQGAPRLEYRLRVDWREIGTPDKGTPHLRVRFPLAAQQPQARYEIPFGSIVRDLDGGEEVVALRWADLSEADGQGVALVNSSKYGFSLEGDTLAMTLLRASCDPDPLPDLGEHVIEYALVPHGEGWTAGDAMGAGESMNVPLVVTSCSFQEGDLACAASFVSVEPAHVRLAALKAGQSGGTVLRLVEVGGQDTTAKVILGAAIAPEGARAQAVDTLERPLATNTARLIGSTLTVKLPAHGIVTVRVG